MGLFSERQGLKPTKKALQLNDIDADLRNGLWNCMHLFLWRHWEEPSPYGTHTPIAKNLAILTSRLWIYHFKLPLDQVADHFSQALPNFRQHFFTCKWHEVFDFIEFVYLNGPDDNRESYAKFCNDVLETENSGYRFLNGHFIEITSENELAEIDQASRTPHNPVNAHIARAIELLTDRNTPDYRNSIKESISAVEALCQRLTGDPKATLGKALTVLEVKVSLHGALRTAFSALYGYTSDANGIRHAMLDEPDISFTEAKYMLVSCSVFINYLIGKAADVKIPDGDSLTEG
ncbi:MAG: hypothetical protein WCQ52_08255 [Actinomycetes bacterium]